MPVVPRSWAVVGSGAVGLYYGGRLAAEGRDVRFLVRSDFDAVQRDGIRVVSPDGDFHLAAPTFARTSAELGPVDVVLIALKATANSVLDEIIPPLLHEGTVLLTLQNGLGNEEYLAERFGADRVMGALCFICLNRVAPAVVHHLGAGPMSVGEYDRAPGPRCEAIVAELAACHVRASVVEDLALERWRKLVWNVPFNGLTIAAGGIPVGPLLDGGVMEHEIRALMDEVRHAAAALGHDIPSSFADYQISRTRPMGDYKPSSLVDFLDRRPLEVEAIWGEPLRRAAAAGASLPRLALLHSLLVHLDRRRLP
jgi:2-dehydropantoate 2-reductase